MCASYYGCVQDVPNASLTATSTHIIIMVTSWEAARKGAGRALIRAVEKLLEDASEVAGIPIRAKYTSVNEDNRALRPFFLKLGFLEEPIPHPMYYVGYLEDLKPSEKLSSRGFANISDVITFSEAGDRLLNTATNISISQGFPMPEGGLLSEAVNRELSFCIVRDGKISAYVTVEDVEDDLIEVSALWSGLDNPVELLSMLIYLIDALKKNYPPETKIAMLRQMKERISSWTMFSVMWSPARTGL